MGTKSSKNRGELSAGDRFYIEQHGTMPVADLAQALAKPEDLIQEYVTVLANKEKKKANSRARDLMARPKKGITIMTEGASAVGDDAKYNRWITAEAINKAIEDGEWEQVERLKKKFAQQQEKQKNIIKNKYSDMIHHITPPDEDED